MKNILTNSLAKYFLPEGNILTSSYSFDKQVENNHIINATREANKLVAYFFSPINVLIGKPVYSLTSSALVVHIFYYMPFIPSKEGTQGKSINSNTVNSLGEALSLIFQRPVELRLVKLHYPYLNSFILAQYIAMNTQDYTLVQILRQVFGSISPVKNTQSLNSLASLLPSHIIGIKVQVSGRLMMERSRPRQTVQTAQVGSFAKDNFALLDNASFTTKNKKGAFTVKVWITQRAI